MWHQEQDLQTKDKSPQQWCDESPSCRVCAGLISRRLVFPLLSTTNWLVSVSVQSATGPAPTPVQPSAYWPLCTMDVWCKAYPALSFSFISVIPSLDTSLLKTRIPITMLTCRREKTELKQNATSSSHQHAALLRPPRPRRPTTTRSHAICYRSDYIFDDEDSWEVQTEGWCVWCEPGGRLHLNLHLHPWVPQVQLCRRTVTL